MDRHLDRRPRSEIRVKMLTKIEEERCLKAGYIGRFLGELVRGLMARNWGCGRRWFDVARIEGLSGRLVAGLESDETLVKRVRRSCQIWNQGEENEKETGIRNEKLAIQ